MDALKTVLTILALILSHPTANAWYQIVEDDSDVATASSVVYLTPSNAAPLITNVVAWYNADYTITTNGLLAFATDLTGKGNHGVQTNEADRLTNFVSDAMFGGKSSFGSMTSTGVRHLAVPSLTARHIFWSVYYKDGVDNTFDVYSFFIGGPGSAGASRVMGTQSLATLYATGAYAPVAYKNGITSSSSTVLPLPASVMRCDGNVTQTWQIGGNTVASPGRVFVGGFRNVVFASSVLSTNTIALIEGVIAWDSNCQTNLVSDHKYRNRQPEWSDLP